MCKDDETTKFPTVSRELLVEEMEAAKRHGIPRSYLCDPDAEWIDKPQGRVQFGSPAHFKALKMAKVTKVLEQVQVDLQQGHVVT